MKNPEGDLRRGPKTRPSNKLTESECAKVLSIACSKEFIDKTPKQIVPTLADRGQYIASEATFYRLLRNKRLLAHRGKAKPPTHERPKELIAVSPNQVWSWDITYLKTQVMGMFFYLYLVMDIYSRKIVGFEVAERESEKISTKLILETCLREGVQRDQLFLHADNGGPMKASTMLITLQRLGVLPSFSRPRVSDDNAYSEALFRTLKYRPFYPSKPFENIEQARAWVEGFVDWYNYEHMHSGINYVTPANRHTQDDEKVLEFRQTVFETARAKNPNRWSKKIRKFESVPFVVLNSLPPEKTKAISISA